MRICLRVFVFALVCGTTWVMTASLRAKPPAVTKDASILTKSAQPTPQGGSQSLGKHNVSTKQDPHTVAQVSLVGGDIEVVDHHALVSAQVSIYDRDPGYSYLWTLRVVTRGNEVLRREVYDQQIFTTNPGETTFPSFHEIIDLPPGENFVQVALYRFPQGLDLGFLEDEPVESRYRAVRSSQKVNVP